MQVGDIVALKNRVYFAPKKIGTCGIVLSNYFLSCEVCWFDDVDEISPIGTEYYGNDRVTNVDHVNIDVIGHKDDNYKVGDELILLSPLKDYLPKNVKPFTTCRFHTMMGSGTSCKIELNDEIFLIGLDYIMKYDDYIKYANINILNNNKNDNLLLLDDIYNSLGE